MNQLPACALAFSGRATHGQALGRGATILVNPPGMYMNDETPQEEEEDEGMNEEQTKPQVPPKKRGRPPKVKGAAASDSLGTLKAKPSNSSVSHKKRRPRDWQAGNSASKRAKQVNEPYPIKTKQIKMETTVLSSWSTCYLKRHLFASIMGASF
ncbi:hypothetical protein DUNSADRAFT_4516 [Dunaliella salina]|uniref:Encoded protein n=1 Tax=Dunaliella salina TaxID=3046 RepID=A0ABQ7GRW9_DUNSA|nr:hypothetical protein DUNSADRAFT_4516 [Dunaliella salina]|eukprot:KAF5837357.1 hypothetical protein DUNSADRAFT_4516 [Dunaliella salina]